MNSGLFQLSHENKSSSNIHLFNSLGDSCHNQLHGIIQYFSRAFRLDSQVQSTVRALEDWLFNENSREPCSLIRYLYIAVLILNMAIVFALVLLWNDHLCRILQWCWMSSWDHTLLPSIVYNFECFYFVFIHLCCTDCRRHKLRLNVRYPGSFMVASWGQKVTGSRK